VKTFLQLLKEVIFGRFSPSLTLIILRMAVVQYVKKTFKCLHGSTSALRCHIKNAHATQHRQLLEMEAPKKEIKNVS
jgi:hypothetical protein